MLSKLTMTCAAAILAYCAIASAAPSQPANKRQAAPENEMSLTTKLRLANSAIERYALLPEDKDFVFDFTTDPYGVANLNSFPALVGAGGALAYASLPACSMSFVHLHPRSAELFLVIDGKLETSMVTEAGVMVVAGNGNGTAPTPRVVSTELSAGQMTVFQQGAFHTQLNTQCTNATAVAAFTGGSGIVDGDFGTAPVAQQFFAYGDDILAASLGGKNALGKDFESIRAAVPKDVYLKLEACVSRCGGSKHK